MSLGRNRFVFFAAFVAIGVVCTLFPSPVPIARAFDPSQRSWISIEIPYYASSNILVKMTAVTVGNNLNGSILIEKIFSSGSVTIGVARAIVQAEYSTDTNTTTFVYTLSSEQYSIHSYGEFPYDGWEISILFETSFNATFDPRVKYCLTPSSNYYANYTTTSVVGQQNTCVLELRIFHPTSFPSYVLIVFLTPILSLGALAAVCILLAMNKRIIDKFYDSFVVVCSAVIVFIPIFELSTQELKTPLTFTWFDAAFLVLFLVYVLLLFVSVLAKLRILRS